MARSVYKSATRNHHRLWGIRWKETRGFCCELCRLVCIFLRNLKVINLLFTSWTLASHKISFAHVLTWGDFTCLCVLLCSRTLIYRSLCACSNHFQSFRLHSSLVLSTSPKRLTWDPVHLWYALAQPNLSLWHSSRCLRCDVCS